MIDCLVHGNAFAPRGASHRLIQPRAGDLAGPKAKTPQTEKRRTGGLVSELHVLPD